MLSTLVYVFNTATLLLGGGDEVDCGKLQWTTINPHKYQR